MVKSCVDGDTAAAAGTEDWVAAIVWRALPAGACSARVVRGAAWAEGTSITSNVSTVVVVSHERDAYLRRYLRSMFVESFISVIDRNRP